jgi:hypothetical protein
MIRDIARRPRAVPTVVEVETECPDSDELETFDGVPDIMMPWSLEAPPHTTVVIATQAAVTLGPTVALSKVNILSA